ncbi:cyclin-like protein [Auriscalpium vulgare]|uniref:Cyclin-like protein n=1 Tax=Auriscalpium vulgare TaxID=40419 RepID=A0ACB8SD08_9AGAM|nr:cyclin-like protein [Auriscalpium vulgare]
MAVPDDPLTAQQWLFPFHALSSTPTAIDRSLEAEMYDRSRGIEFLFRLGTSIALHHPGIFTAATWFHRFYMRYSMEDHHRQAVAASCIFLATKTEECGRKLRDVARVYCAKARNVDVREIPENGKWVEEATATILLTEEVLLDALCFDFVIESPHAALVDLLEAHQVGSLVEDYAWSIAHDSYRTPLCVLYAPKIIATACYVLAQYLADGPHATSLDSRISSAAPSASLPTPPTHKPGSPDQARFAVGYFRLSADELSSVAESLDLLLEFYRFQESLKLVDYLGKITEVPPPSIASSRPMLYPPRNANDADATHQTEPNTQSQTPNSVHGSRTPVEKPPRWAPVVGEPEPDVHRHT